MDTTRTATSALEIIARVNDATSAGTVQAARPSVWIRTRARVSPDPTVTVAAEEPL